MRQRSAAFTLLEMLTVIAIVAVITAIAVPAYTTISRASGLTNSASLLVDQLTRGRQEALAKNRVVEARFYQIPDELGGAASFRAFRLWVYDQTVQTAAPLTNLFTFSNGIVVSSDVKFSTLMNRSASPQTEIVSGYKDPLPYQSFRFRATGGTDLDPSGLTSADASVPPDHWFLTLKAASDPVAGTLPAHNYVTILLDPVSGRVRIFRP